MGQQFAVRVLRRGSQALMSPFRRACESYLGVITAVATDKPALALTFDDGPHDEYTPAVLEILAKHRAKATFFIIGELAALHPDIVRATAQAGHTIANHSWSHLSFPLMTACERYEQLRRCEEVLSPYGEKFFRPPYCHQTPASRWHTMRGGYEVVGFSAHAEDWLARPPAWMCERLVRQARPGAIIILHDNIYRSVLPATQPDRKPMLTALDNALEQMQERFSFVTIPDLLRMGTPLREQWYRRGLADMRPALERHLREQRRPGNEGLIMS
jgi:peptidoglycan/xylan/chitin deacetylase (PgdA/CDA1 family)